MVSTFLVHNLEYLGSNMAVPSLQKKKRKSIGAWDLTKDGRAVGVESPGCPTLHPECLLPPTHHFSVLLSSLPLPLLESLNYPSALHHLEISLHPFLILFI